MKIAIGIDPSIQVTNCGFAKVVDGKLIELKSGEITDFKDEILKLHRQLSPEDSLLVYIEDASKRGANKNNDPFKERAKLQSVGKLKATITLTNRDLTKAGVKVVLTFKHDLVKYSKPGALNTWKGIFKWKGRTSEHARMAALLVHHHIK